MSIKVTDFKWEKGKNDLEYIALLEKHLDAMSYKFRECAKIAKEQYYKGRESAFKEIAYSDNVTKEQFEKLAYNKGKADAFKEFVDSYREFITTPNKEACFKEDIECDGMCVDCFVKWVKEQNR